jgi:hypothetical protein
MISFYSFHVPFTKKNYIIFSFRKEKQTEVRTSSNTEQHQHQ